jgi:hypothetical protein
MSKALVCGSVCLLAAVSGCVLVDAFNPPDNGVQSEVRDFSAASVFRYGLTVNNASLDLGTVVSLEIKRLADGEYSLRFFTKDAPDTTVSTSIRLLTNEERDAMLALFAHINLITEPIPETCAETGIPAYYEHVEWDGESFGPRRCDSTTYIRSDDWSTIRTLLADLVGPSYTIVGS